MHGLAHLRRVALRQGKPRRPLALPHPVCLSVRIRGFFVSVPRVTFHRSRCSFRYADCPSGPTRGRGALRHPLVSFRLGAVGLGVIRVPLPGLPAGRGWFSHLPDLPPGAPCIRRSAHRLEMCRVSYSSKPCTVSSLLIASAVSPQLILVRSKWPRFLRVSGAFGFLGAVGRCRRDGRGASVGCASCALDFPLHTCQTGASLCRVSLGHPQIE